MSKKENRKARTIHIDELKVVFFRLVDKNRNHPTKLAPMAKANRIEVNDSISGSHLIDSFGIDHTVNRSKFIAKPSYFNWSQAIWKRKMKKNLNAQNGIERSNEWWCPQGQNSLISLFWPKKMLLQNLNLYRPKWLKRKKLHKLLPKHTSIDFILSEYVCTLRTDFA